MPAAKSAPRTRVTVSPPIETARYLRSTSNASTAVRKAVEAYRARELAQRLEEAYRAGRGETERINREWEHADAEASE